MHLNTKSGLFFNVDLSAKQLLGSLLHTPINRIEAFLLHTPINRIKAFNSALSCRHQSNTVIAYNTELARWHKTAKFQFRVDHYCN